MMRVAGGYCRPVGPFPDGGGLGTRTLLIVQCWGSKQLYVFSLNFRRLLHKEGLLEFEEEEDCCRWEMASMCPKSSSSSSNGR